MNSAVGISAMDMPRRRTLWRSRIPLIVAIAIAALAAAVWFATTLSRSSVRQVDRASVVVATVRSGELVREASGSGTLVADRARIIAADTSGRVEKLTARTGDAVEATTILVQMRNVDVQEAAAAAGTALAAAEAELSASRAELEQRILAIRAEVAQLEAESDESSARAKSVGELAKAGLVSTAESHLADVRAVSASKRFALARQRLAAAERGLQPQIATKEVAAREARTRYAARTDQMHALDVAAQMHGVVEQIFVTEGQVVAAGEKLARIADERALIARVQISPQQARDVRRGMRCSIATHNGTFAGTVIAVDPTVRDGSVSVDIRPDTYPAGVRPDTPIEAKIVTGSIAQTLAVARPVNVQEGAAADVFRIDAQSGVATRTRVTFGRGSATELQVTRGLREGDQIIVSDTSAFGDAARLRLR